MADLCATWTFGSLSIYGAAEEGQDRLVWVEDGLVGWDGRPITRPRDPASRTAGSNVYEATLRDRILQVSAIMSVGSVGHEDGLTTEYLTAYNALEAAVKAALVATLNTPTALAVTPTGGSPISDDFVYGAEGDGVTFTGPMIARICQFTLVEVSDDIIT